MTVQITAEDRAIMDEMTKEADRGELTFHREAALHRDPDGPALSDEDLAAIISTGMERLRMQRAEDQTARKIWRVRPPEELDDMAKRLADKEGLPKSAIVRKAVAYYAKATLGNPATA